jgi:GH25 family lysozyme M1 (1,4-beta-N-acetylmuramidase)
MTSTFGCDVSSYQPSTLVPWTDARIGFGIVKASEGVRQSPALPSHVRAIRTGALTNTGLKLGLYHFFESNVPVGDQMAAFVSATVSAGLAPGDIVPALDIESNIGRRVTPDWVAPVRDFCDQLEAKFGSVMPYCSWSTWIQMGAPAFLLSLPLWVPYYAQNGHVRPAQCYQRPGNVTPVIWQNFVGTLFGTTQNTNAYQAVDQNLLIGTLPLIKEISP